MSQADWDLRFLLLARHVSTWSKDPSTQCGAVITQGKRIRSLGFNGFPQGISDAPEDYTDRDLKYAQVVHAEANALLFADGNTEGCTVYVWPFQPCSTCAAMLIQARITRVVTLVPDEERLKRWEDSFKVSARMFDQAGVSLDFLELPAE